MAAKPATELQSLIEGAKAELAKMPAGRSVVELDALDRRHPVLRTARAMDMPASRPLRRRTGGRRRDQGPNFAGRHDDHTTRGWTSVTMVRVVDIHAQHCQHAIVSDIAYAKRLRY